MRDRPLPSTFRRDEHERSVSVGWFIGGGVIYLVLLITLGILTIRKGHWVMFLVGFIFPLFWLIGGIMRPVRRVR
jgi:hypothetical protein